MGHCSTFQLTYLENEREQADVAEFLVTRPCSGREEHGDEGWDWQEGEQR